MGFFIDPAHDLNMTEFFCVLFPNNIAWHEIQASLLIGNWQQALENSDECLVMSEKFDADSPIHRSTHSPLCLSCRELVERSSIQKHELAEPYSTLRGIEIRDISEDIR
jgi:hypothetical protein